MSSVAKAPRRPRVTAEVMAGRQRDISVSEFFAKNRHLLGFDNPRKALLTTVKEAVDNALDACEEAGILPDVTVVIEDLQPDRAAGAKSSRYRVTVVDNGPGIVRKQVENIFGRLLYGSKFHRLKMSRGQQGIGISAAGMYGLITTGKPTIIHTRPDTRKPAHHIELAMNTKTNRAEVTVDVETQDFPPARLRDLHAATRRLAKVIEPEGHAALLDERDYPTGTSVSIELEGRYQRGRGSVDEFLELTAIANPHARISFVAPTKISGDDDSDVSYRGQPRLMPESAETAGGNGTFNPVQTLEHDGVTFFPRAVHELPRETQEIQPHPRGVELGTLLQMVKDHQASEGGSLYSFLQDRFCRVSPTTASKLCEAIGATSRTRLSDVDPARVEKLYRELQEVKLPPPPTDCLAPIGVRQMLAGLLKGVRAEFYAASSREPAVYRGRPFQIEAALAYGGELPGDEQARVIRFANRVPLQYQQSACSSFKAVIDTSWKNYNLQQPRGGLPVGPLVIMIHMASVWVPFTSESKEAIADYDEIRKEMKLALMECGRKLGTYLNKRQKMRRESERRDVFERYIGEISRAIESITGREANLIYDALLTQARKHTAIADAELDEDGKVVRKVTAPDDDGIIIIEQPRDDHPELPPVRQTRGEAAALKVAARAKDLESPVLISDSESAEPGKRTKPTKSPRTKASKPASAKAANRPTLDPDRKPASGRSTRKSRTDNAAPATKPRAKLRWVDGKLVRVDDEPGLF
ncbi:MAG: DNA topoisomerase VI subunit B [Phycisphaeraceae bacterium]|nr:DNA topoisomerase VI subunit B [Phycisphaeraceae bacterium]MCW5754115.1 DNA topoisomerase VI subunit B [Phycisphaeraceae bacterium]